MGPRARLPITTILTGALGATLFLASAAAPSASRGQEAAPAPAPRAIVAIVRGLRNDRGHVRGGIYDSQDGFPDTGRELTTCRGPIVSGVARCRFENMPAGRYAIGMMHDEDADGVFDKNFLGIPEEGYGFTRDAHGGLGAPSFESAAFDYDGRSVRATTINIRYGI